MYKRDLPINEIIPHIVQTTTQNPTEPVYSNASPGDTKIPEPIITPNIKLTAENNPSSLLSSTCSETVDFFFLAFLSDELILDVLTVTDHSLSGTASEIEEMTLK